MGLLWLILFVSITVVAVDIIHDSRIRTMLLATADADAAALGDAIDLPAPAAVVASAVAYSAGDIGPAIEHRSQSPCCVERGRSEVHRAPP